MKVCANLALNERPAYTSNEIVATLKATMKKQNHSAVDLANMYSTSRHVVEVMLDENTYYSYEMMEIASDYIKVPFEDLTKVLEDDNHISCRGEVDEETDELFDIINYVFDEIIRQERLAK